MNLTSRRKTPTFHQQLSIKSGAIEAHRRRIFSFVDALQRIYVSELFLAVFLLQLGPYDYSYSHSGMAELMASANQSTTVTQCRLLPSVDTVTHCAEGMH